MSEHMTEEQARARLLAANSPAYDSANYGAKRLANGWSFSWARAPMDAPMGTRAWVVADSGVVMMVPIGRIAASVLGELVGDQ